MNVCPICNELFPNALEGPESSPSLELDIETAKLEKSAEEGCQTCCLIRDAYGKFNKHVGNGTIRLSGSLEHAYPQGLILWGSLGLRIHVLKGEKCPWEIITPAGLPMEHLTMDNYTKFISSWYHQCTTNHKVCSVLSNSNLLGKLFAPTRLIYVGNSIVKETLYPYESGSQPDDNSNKYIALSHCWGSVQIIRTTKTTYIDRKAGIVWSSLPKTFQDAITVTRSLGIQYIWIDSLCIIQDDTDDWIRESSKMAEVYRNSYLTIAASAASSGEQGFLVPRPKIHKLSGERNGSSYTIYVRQMLDHTSFRRAGKASNRPLPLLNRCWTLQEQLLSPRFVHFTTEELVWDCNAGCFCECEENAPSAFKKGLAQSLVHESDLSNAWRSTIEQYSSRKLTFDRDRLPALSGLGSLFTPELGQYLAGLWSADLPFSLLWVSKYGPGRRSAHANNPRSSPPSWSWASVECSQISWQRWVPGSQSAVEILSAECEASTSDPRGLVAGGSITLKGKMFPMVLYYKPQDDKGNTRVIFRLCNSSQVKTASEYPDTAVGQFDTAVCQFDVSVNLAGEDFVASGEIIYFIIIAIAATEHKSEKGFRYDGLYLQALQQPTREQQEEKTGMRSDGVFRRIGAGALGPKADLDAYSIRTVTIL